MLVSKLSLALIVLQIASLTAQIHLNRSNLASICKCLLTSDLIDLTSKSISLIDAFTFQGLNASEISLSDNQLTSLDELTFQNMANLEILYLPFNQIAQLHPKIFKGLSNLKELYLSENKLTSVDSNIFKVLLGFYLLNFHFPDRICYF